MYLLDSHSLIWASAEPDRLSATARSAIEDPGQRCFVSVATLWELLIKAGLGKIDLPDSFFTKLYQTGFERLDIEDSHLAAYRALPFLHRDPFDRMLVAQAKVEGLTLITCDAEITRYGVPTLQA